MTNSDSTSTESPPLHELLTSHLKTCSECREALKKRTPNGLGMSNPYCSKYLEIIRLWAEREGQVNNIVDHDEYGNKASKRTHERYPEQWQ